MATYRSLLLICLLALVFLTSPVAAFGAGNIASISSIEGLNWRHGDIEDMLKTVAFLRGMFSNELHHPLADRPAK